MAQLFPNMVYFSKNWTFDSEVIRQGQAGEAFNYSLIILRQ